MNQSVKSTEDYSPANFFRIFDAVPVATSSACLGTKSNVPVFYLIDNVKVAFLL